MKKFFVSLAGSFLLLTGAARDHLNIMTFNIRYDNKGDSLNAWPYRKENAGGQILFHEARVVGVQEALHHQMEDLQLQLARFRYLGVGREDGGMITQLITSL